MPNEWNRAPIGGAGWTAQGRRRGRAGAIALALLGGAWLATMQRAGADEASLPVHMETLQVTASAQQRSVHSAAAAVTVLDESLIRARNTALLPEIMRGQVGTWFQQTTPGQGTPILRGLKGSQVLNLVDGMRLNNAFFRSAPSQYLSLVDPWNVQQVEVVRGPSPTLYGHDAMGGVVNVLTPEPGLSAGEWVLGGKFLASVDSAHRSRLLRASAQAGGRRLAWSAGLSWQDLDDRRTGGATVTPTAYRSQGADAKLIYAPDHASEFLFAVQSARQPSTPRIDELVPGYGQDAPSSEEFYFEPNSRDFYHGRYRWTPDAGLLEELVVQVARQVITDDRRTRDSGSSLRQLEFNDSTLDGVVLRANFVLPERLAFSLGLETYDDEVRSSRRVTDLDSELSLPATGRYPDGASMKSAAVFAHAEVPLTPRWRLGGGVRYSRFKIQAPESTPGGGFLLQPDDLTGDLSLAFRPSQALHLSLNLGRGFRPPNIFDLGGLGPRPGNRFNTVNPDLAPESVLTLDLGMKYSGQTWQGELFAWRSRYQDQIASVATGESTPEGRVIVRSENLDQVQLWGWEAGLRYRPAEALALFGVCNWTRGQEISAGGAVQPADRIPPLNGQLGLEWQAADPLEFQVWVMFAGRQDRLSERDREDPRINPDGTDGWTTLNASLRWQWRPNLELGLRLENLTDEIYRDHGSGIDGPGFNTSLRVMVSY